MVQLAVNEIGEIVRQQRGFFSTGQTKNLDFRIDRLKHLKQVVLDNRAAVIEALAADLGKPGFETVLTEISIVFEQIDYVLKHIKSWAKPKRTSVPFTLFPASARIYSEPLGVVLIISPWNYPFLLAISPLIGAIAAGNCAIVKPSEIAPHTSRLLAEIVEKNFNPAYITVVEGGVETSQQLLEEKFDHIFFTGGTQVGKIIMAAAAKHLTPVTLELGGKSPCIVETDVQLESAARRIVWGKFINAGQTCIAPDYLLVNRQIKPDLLSAIQGSIKEFYGDNPANSPDYARIISDKHYQRLTQLLDPDKIVAGGQVNPQQRYIAPTVLDRVSREDAAMQEEIFGPILPIIEYGDLSEAIAIINQKPKPLALYFFSNNRKKQARILRETSSGGVGLNHMVLQMATPALPFGGVGNSGMGAYHGKASFDTFSHQKSVFSKPFWLDLKLLYPPYEGKLELLKKFLG
jgi:acyl-CoA reductase-like NAD-dependent aldehyde dehydrogenase